VIAKDDNMLTCCMAYYAFDHFKKNHLHNISTLISSPHPDSSLLLSGCSLLCDAGGRGLGEFVLQVKSTFKAQGRENLNAKYNSNIYYCRKIKCFSIKLAHHMYQLVQYYHPP
jgi:hypothetical protein